MDIRKILDILRKILITIFTVIGFIFKKIGFIITTFILIGAVTGAICGTVFAVYLKSYIIPKAEMDIGEVSMNFSSIIYYEEDGEYKELQTLHAEENRIWSSSEEIPDYLENAVVAIEDQRFYTHNGVDWKRTLSATVNWVLPISSSYGGGSTITQQLIKNVTTDNDFSVQRKMLEIFRALNLESKMEKEDILELYLNTVYFGRNAYGVNTAALTYFGKEVSELNLAECAVIAGITNNPSLYDPYTYPNNAKSRQETILYQMYDQGYISKYEYDTAVAYPLVYQSSSSDDEDEDEEEESEYQSYFVDQVITDVINDLMEQKGYSSAMASTLVYAGGLSIYATIDIDVQNALETVYEDPESVPGVMGTNGAYPQSAMAIMDPSTGQVKGLIGGKGEKEGNRVLNRATSTYRQPGSAIKPLSVYALAFDMGIVNPNSVVIDMPYMLLNDSAWPINSTNGGGYQGQMEVSYAIDLSINTVAVDLIYDVGIDNSYAFLEEKLGISSLVDSRATDYGTVLTDRGASQLALGGLTDGMSVLELTAAYAAIANGGIYIEPITYTKVLDSNGDILIENTQETVALFENKYTNEYLVNVLESVVSQGTATQTDLGRIATAGKTGSSSSNNDRWYVGFTPYYVGATWYGYDTPQQVTGAGTNPSATLWKMVMDIVHEDLPDAEFEKSGDFVEVAYCLDSGLTPTQYCYIDMRGSRVTTGLFAPGDAPQSFCNLHVPVDIDSTTNMAATEYCPPENIIHASMLDITRLFETPILLSDGDYVINGSNEPIGEGVPTYGPGNVQLTVACTEHDHTTGTDTGTGDEVYTQLVYDDATGYYKDLLTGDLYDPFTLELVYSAPRDEEDTDTTDPNTDGGSDEDEYTEGSELPDAWLGDEDEEEE